jgi:hypothetical protein
MEIVRVLDECLRQRLEGHQCRRRGEEPGQRRGRRRDLAAGRRAISPRWFHLRGVRRAVLIGEAAPVIRRALAGHVELADARDMPDAVRIAHDVAQAGDTVLLAPACASFDMFKNYQERGEVFRACVNGVVDKYVHARTIDNTLPAPDETPGQRLLRTGRPPILVTRLLMAIAEPGACRAALRRRQVPRDQRSRS